MKKGTIWIVLTCLMVISMVLASCNKTTTTAMTSTTTASTTVKTTTTLTTTSPSTSATITTTASTTGNWWDKLGIPQYGGTITMRMVANPTLFDPYNSGGLPTFEETYMERLWADQWTTDPAQWDYSKVTWRPDSVEGGLLAQSWEFTDATTFVIHLRQGIHWQDIAPANGREFVASDIVSHYNRLFGLGVLPGSAVQQANTAYKKLISVTAPDKYTVIFKWSIGNPTFILSTLQAPAGSEVDIECPDVVNQYGVLNDWNHAIGTGPFILKDFVSGSSATLIRNPNYWGHDERYPKNQLPYVDTLRILVIPDDSTALSALRTGKIEVMGNISASNSNNLKKTNPELLVKSVPASYTNSVDPKGNTPPFNDINIRKAMQMAIDLPTIAESYYLGSCSANPSTMTSNNMGMGWGYPYGSWPQTLKDEYAYNVPAAKKLLADAGFPNGFKTNIMVPSDTDLDLLQIVKSYFKVVGIDMSINVMDPSTWINVVQTGHKQDQLSQKSTGFLGMTFDIDRQMQRFVTGANWNVISDPNCDNLYAQTLAATTVEQYQKIFNQFNQYVAQQHFVISLLNPTFYYFYQPWLHGFMGQDNSGGIPTAVRLEGFYTARFWIDQNLKNSMGH
jgi:peptide/nickel transport system substrate-binding protein